MKDCIHRFSVLEVDELHPLLVHSHLSIGDPRVFCPHILWENVMGVLVNGGRGEPLEGVLVGHSANCHRDIDHKVKPNTIRISLVSAPSDQLALEILKDILKLTATLTK